MEDLYESLIGAAPSKQQQKALVSALRRRRDLGELGMLTGDRVLSPFGANMVKQSDSYADQLQGIRQKDADNAQTEAYQTGQLAHMDSVLKETMRGRNQTDATTRRGQDLDFLAARARAAALAQRGPGGRKYKNIPDAAKKDGKALQMGIGVLDDMSKTFKDEYAGKKNMPGVNFLKNTAAANQVGPEKWQEQQAWYGNLERLYSMQERYKVFGATLTTNELKSWANANLNPNMSPKQIREKLGTLKHWAETERDTRRAGYETDEFNPEEVYGAFGGTPPQAAQGTSQEEGEALDDQAELDVPNELEGSAPAPRKAAKRIIVDWHGNQQ